MKLEERKQTAIDGMLGNVILRMDVAALGGGIRRFLSRWMS